MTITLAPKLLSGSFDVLNLHGFPETGGKLNVSGSWKCASLFKRTQ